MHRYVVCIISTLHVANVDERGSVEADTQDMTIIIIIISSSV